MDLDRPLDLGRDARHLDDSGTPTALIEMARRAGDLAVLDDLTEEVLVEFPMGAIWRRQTGCDRFVLLRAPLNGCNYALVRSSSPQAAASATPAPVRSDSDGQPTLPILPYAKEDIVGAKAGLQGAGIMAYLTGDQMHPPMVDKPELWADAAKWRQAAEAHTRAAAHFVDLRTNDSLLDIGCGVGGPARQLVDEFDVRVHGVANSNDMVETSQRINATRPRWESRITVEFHDCQNAYRQGPFDVAWSMNMLYVVPDKLRMLGNIARALKPNGRLMLEDWMLTARATEADRRALATHFVADTFAEVEPLEGMLSQCGFQVIRRDDMGHVGRSCLAKYHNKQFNEKIRPRLEADFPARPKSKQPSGRQMADEWIAGIDQTVRLYRCEKMTYLRLVAVV